MVNVLIMGTGSDVFTPHSQTSAKDHNIDTSYRVEGIILTYGGFRGHSGTVKGSLTPQLTSDFRLPAQECAKVCVWMVGGDRGYVLGKTNRILQGVSLYISRYYQGHLYIPVPVPVYTCICMYTGV